MLLDETGKKLEPGQEVIVPPPPGPWLAATVKDINELAEPGKPPIKRITLTFEMTYGIPQQVIKMDNIRVVKEPAGTVTL